MKKDHYTNEVEKLQDNLKVVDYISLLRDESLAEKSIPEAELVTEIFAKSKKIKQVVLAIDENENLVFTGISFWGKFNLLNNTSTCKISKEEGYNKLKLAGCDELNGIYSVKAKLRSGKYKKEELIDIIVSK